MLVPGEDDGYAGDRGATLVQKRQPVSDRIFKTQRGRITLTDENLIYEQKREPQWLMFIVRADITEFHLVVHAPWYAPTWIEMIVRHRGGALSIPHVGQRAAHTLRKALGF